MKIKYIILSLIILLVPTFVKASDVDYEITNYYIDSYIIYNCFSCSISKCLDK